MKHKKECGSRDIEQDVLRLAGAGVQEALDLRAYST
jgi:hypothetical protein